MKDRKVKIIILLILIVIIFILNRNELLRNKKQLIKEMSESTQVSDLNSSIDRLNTEHDEYKRYIAESKAQIAQAITTQGVETLNTATFETIVNNIKSINYIDNADFNIYLLSARTYDSFVSNVTYDVSDYNILEFTTEPNMLNIYGDGQLIKSVANTTETIDISEYDKITFKGELSPTTVHGTNVQGAFKK